MNIITNLHGIHLDCSDSTSDFIIEVLVSYDLIIEML